MQAIKQQAERNGYAPNCAVSHTINSISAHRPALTPLAPNPPRHSPAQRKKRAHAAHGLLLRRAVLVILLMLLSFLLGRYCAAMSRAQNGVLPVEAVQQNPSLPNGCEVASLTATLQYYGYKAEETALYREYLPKAAITENSEGELVGPSPESAYAGNAESETQGWYCFEQPLAAAANIYLARQESRQTAQALSGVSTAVLASYLAAGTPVIVWVTLEYAAPRYSAYHWRVAGQNAVYVPYANLHCVVLTGIVNDVCYVTDPLLGSARVPLPLFLKSYTAMGSRAVVIM